MSKSFKRFKSKFLKASVILTAGVVTYSMAYGAELEFGEKLDVENVGTENGSLVQDKVEVKIEDIKTIFYKKKNELKVKWADFEGAEGYRVYRVKSLDKEKISDDNLELLAEVDSPEAILENVNVSGRPKVSVESKELSKVDLKVEMEEVESEYVLYIEALGKQNKVLGVSDLSTVKIGEELKGYSYKVSSKKEEKVDSKVDVQVNKSIEVRLSSKKKYIHIKGVYESGATSDTAVMELPLKDEEIVREKVDVGVKVSKYSHKNDQSAWTNGKVDINVLANSDVGFKTLKKPDGEMDVFGVSDLHLVGGSGVDIYTNVKPTKDGGFIVSGKSQSKELVDKSIESGKRFPIDNKGDFDGIIVKYSKDAKIEMVSSWGSDGYDGFHDVVEVIKNGEVDGYMAVGERGGSKNRNAVVVMFNKDGTYRWHDVINGQGSDAMRSVVQDSRGDLVVSGWSDLSNNYDSGLVIRIYSPNNSEPKKVAGADRDRQGEGRWERESINCVIESPDGGYVAVGSIKTYDNSSSGYLDNRALIVKYDSKLNVQWSKTFGGDYDSKRETSFNNAIIAKNGDIVVVGNGDSLKAGDIEGDPKGLSDGFLVRYDYKTGDMKWQTRFGGSKEEQAYCVSELPNGDLVATGYTKSADGDFGRTIKSSKVGPGTFVITLDGSTGEKVGLVTIVGGPVGDYGLWTGMLNDGRLVTVGKSASGGNANADAFLSFPKGATSVSTVHSVEKNGEYEFEYTDIKNKKGKYIVKVGNIDKELPSIKLLVKGVGAKRFISVEAEDNVGIDVLKWSIGEKDSTYFKEGGERVEGKEIKGLKESMYTIYAKDLAGNEKIEVIEVKDKEAPRVELRSSVKHKENYIRLDWGVSPSDEGYVYKGYRRALGESEYQTISMVNTGELGKVNVLNIYPEHPYVDKMDPFTTWDGESISGLPVSASLKKWMEMPTSENAKGYGKGLIEVTPVSIKEFNRDPQAYLKDGNGYKYDVIFEGAMDGYQESDLTEESLKEIESFIDTGRGYLIGHDSMWLFTPVRAKLASRANIINTKNGLPGAQVGNEKIEITRRGLLTEYPWNIGKVGDRLNVPFSHTTEQFGYGDEWLRYVVDKNMMYATPEWEQGIPPKEYIWDEIDGKKGTNLYYLQTWKNTAMIQTGHSGSQATPDEQKILANTLFYLKQLTNAKQVNDMAAMDTSGPIKPTYDMKIKKINRLFKSDEEVAIINVSSEDVGNTYEYYIEATHKSNFNEVIKSNVEKAEIKTGLKGYSYEVSTESELVPDDVVDTVDGVIEVKKSAEKKYLHVKALDNAGNSSEVAHYELPVETPEISLAVTPVHLDNYMKLKWKLSLASDKYTYKSYGRKMGDSEFKPLPANTQSGKKVNVLNLYPTNNIPMDTAFTTYDGEKMELHVSARLKRWMEEPNEESSNGYGRGVIEVAPVAISEFNKSPKEFLVNNDGSWKYDVIMVGSYDSNGQDDLSEKAIELLNTFIREGRGLLLGHDTMSSTKNIVKAFSAEANVKVLKEEEGYGVGDKQIKITRKGLLTTYPWEIGSVGTVLGIPRTHTTLQAATKSDIWMDFVDITDGSTVNDGYYEYAPEELYETETHSNNFYLSTANNVAVIQTGHSNGEGTPDEQKLLANTLFYLNQLSQDKETEDRGAMDFGSPIKPNIKKETVRRFKLFKGYEESIVLDFGSEDTGTTYEHYVEGLHVDNPSEKLKSNTTKTEIKSGLKGFSYVIDTSKTTEPDSAVDMTGRKLEIQINPGEVKYVHVKAIDNVGNESETVHYELKLPGMQTDYSLSNGEIKKKDGSAIRNVLRNGEYKYSFDVSNLTGTPFIETFGGSGSEHIYDTIVHEGNYISVGFTTSNSHDFSGMGKGAEDAFIVKHNNKGEMIWKKVVGGSKSDYAMTVDVASDGYVVAGYSASSNGDFSGTSATTNTDIYIMKIDFDGNTKWKTVIDVRNWDTVNSMVRRDDGGYILVGNTQSHPGFNSSDKKDMIVVGVSASGQKEYVKFVGGNGEDMAERILNNGDGTYTIIGPVFSSSGLGSPRGGEDGVLVKVDGSGNVLKVQRFGGSRNDHFRDAYQMDNGDFIVVGYTESNDKDLAGVKTTTDRDGLVVKFDKNWNVKWVRAIGGTGSEWFLATYVDEMGVMVSGFGNSNNGDFAGLNKGAYDAIIARISQDGSLEWTRSFGGSGEERLRTMVRTPEGGYLIGGDTTSRNGDLPNENRGAQDALLVKFNPDGSFGMMPHDTEISKIEYKIETNKSGVRRLIKEGIYVDQKVGLGEKISKSEEFKVPDIDADEVIITTMLKDNQDSDSRNNKIVTSIPILKPLPSDFALDNDKILDLKGREQEEVEIGLDYKFKFDALNIDTTPFIKTFGGGGNEHFEKHIVTKYGGIVGVGRSTSSDGDVVERNKGNTDAIIVKYDHNGNLEWQDSFGGSGADFFYNVVETKDGGFVAVGQTSSSNDDLSGYSVVDNDAIMVKYDSKGKIVWKKVFVRNGKWDRILHIEEDSDGNLIIENEKCDINYSSSDTFIEKLSPNGNLIWSTRLASNNIDNGYGISLTRNGDVLVAGRFVNATNDFAGKGFKGGNDAYIARLDGSNGRVRWLSTYGGSGNDDARSVVESENGDLVIIGRTTSDDYTFSGQGRGKRIDDLAGMNGYLATMDASNGNLKSVKVYGGSKYDNFRHLSKTNDGGYLVSGDTESSDYDFSGYSPRGIDAVWIKFDSRLNEVWKGYISGEGDDATQSGIPLSDGSIVVAGETKSNDGDFNGLNKGGQDAFVAKLNSDGELDVYPHDEETSIKYELLWSDGKSEYPVKSGTMEGVHVPVGSAVPQEISFEVPRDSTIKTLKLKAEIKDDKDYNEKNNVVEKVIDVVIPRDYLFEGYNVKESGKSELVGTLRKNTRYDLNLKLQNKYIGTQKNRNIFNLNDKAGKLEEYEPKIESLKYKIVSTDGLAPQDVKDITIDNVKGAVLAEGEKKDVPVPDESSVWDKIEFKTLDDESMSEVIFVAELDSVDDGDKSNNRFVVKLPILNKVDPNIDISNVEIHPAGGDESDKLMIGNEMNVKVTLDANTIRTHDVGVKLYIEDGEKRVVLDKKAYGISKEYPGVVYFKYQPSGVGEIKVVAEINSVGGKEVSQPVFANVSKSEKISEYEKAQENIKDTYDISSEVVTYVKMEKRDKDIVKVRYCSDRSNCQQEFNGSLKCPGHEYFDWGEWYVSYIPMKSTELNGFEEWYEIEKVLFRSKETEKLADKLPDKVDDGMIDMLDKEKSKYAVLKAGYGFELKMETEYRNNLPKLMSKAYTPNISPSDTAWSQYKIIPSENEKIPFIYHSKEFTGIDEMIVKEKGVVSFVVPSLDDVIIENPDQLYVKMPDEEYVMIDEGYGEVYDNNVSTALEVTKKGKKKVYGDFYSDLKVVEFKEVDDGLRRKRNYYTSAEMKDGVHKIGIFNRYSGYGPTDRSKLHNKKDIEVIIRGSKYDDIIDMRH